MARPNIKDRVVGLFDSFGEPVWCAWDGPGEDYSDGGRFVGRALLIEAVRSTFPGPAVDKAILDLLEHGHARVIYVEYNGDLLLFERGPHSDCAKMLLLSGCKTREDDIGQSPWMLAASLATKARASEGEDF